MKTPLYANTLIPAHVKTHLESTPIQGINSIFFQGHSKWTGLQRIYPAPWHNLGHMSLIFVHIRPCQNSHVPVLENSITWSADSKPQISGSQASLHIRIIWEALKGKKKQQQQYRAVSRDSDLIDLIWNPDFGIFYKLPPAILTFCQGWEPLS